jgi:cell wall-associated NlpC family hydrolase
VTYRRRRYRRRYRRFRRQDHRALLTLAVLAVAVLIMLRPGGHGTAASAGTGAPPSGVAARVISFAQHRLGCPYVWGDTGPCSAGYDCSGLAMKAYASAGIRIHRTSGEQWQAGPQVSTPRPGDLVFFAGGDGTWAYPGHVGIVVDPARHLMIDAYASGTNVRYDSYGLATSAPGLSDPVGFTAPGSRS